MPITSDILKSPMEFNFIFRGNEIILKDGKLPDNDLMQKCLKLNVASDWLEEKQLNYAAILLEDDTPDPKGYENIPIRYFFSQSDEKMTALASRAKGILNFKASKRFCAKCGAPLKDDENFTARTCVKCGHQYFPQLEPAVIVLVKKGDEILLGRHKKRNDDVYSTLAGFVEMGETAEHAVKREIMEESGISVKNIKYVGSQSWPFPDQLMLAFTAEYESGEIKIQEEELSDVRFFKRDNLPNVPKPGSVAHNLIFSKFDS